MTLINQSASGLEQTREETLNQEPALTTSLVSTDQPDHSGGWYSVRPLYRYIWRTSRSKQIGICLLVAIITPLPMVSLEFQRRIIDDALGARNVRLLIALGTGYVALISLRLLLKYAADIVKGRTAETIARDMRLRIMRGRQAIWPRSYDDSDDEKIGTAISMLGAETEDMSGFAGDALSLPLLTGGTMMWVLGYLMWIEPLITAIALILYFPQIVIVPAIQFTINRLARLRIVQLRNLSHLAIHGSSKGRGRGQTVGQVFIDRLYRIRIRIYLRKFFITELGNFLDSLGPVMVLSVGGYLVIAGETEVSTLFVFISGLQKVADPWDQMITFYRTVSNTGVMFDMIRARLVGTQGEIS
ncbi:ABC transporter ATP-binding protein [Taklimakanibacter deserti]|uniref:ABC transporter transmembrane domain-containing protein n=1 Tax=Taklimakanibacter deserti TaxID=2267839 RepID=UPI0013C4006E